MDEDLRLFTTEQLIAEAQRLRDAIRKHRDSSGDALCWHHPQLWGLLPERSDPLPVVPEWPQFLRGCVTYRQSLDDQLPDAPRTSRAYAPVDPKLVALRFNAAINARDLERLVALMTEDHRFIDSANNETKGRAAMREAWRGFFAAFPDYQNEFDSLSSNGDQVVITGRSICSNLELHGPAIWRAIVRDNLISEWRVGPSKEPE